MFTLEGSFFELPIDSKRYVVVVLDHARHEKVGASFDTKEDADIYRRANPGSRIFDKRGKVPTVTEENNAVF
jgi:hypothetical protein